MSPLDLLDPPVAQVQELAVVTEDPYHPVEHQGFHQVVLEAALELDPQTSAPSAGLEVPDSVATWSRLEASALVPFMEV